jgi:hypothetical protein
LKVNYFILIFFQLLGFIAKGQSITQEIVSFGGGNYNQINGSLEFNVGEVVVQTYSNSYCKLFSGFEQGYYDVLSIDEIDSKNTSFSLYPNPTNGKTNLIVTTINTENSTGVLIDIFGKKLFEFDLVFENSIDLSNYSAGIYILNINSNEGKLLKTFKILKNE